MIKTKLPAYDYSLLIRTDFSDDKAWGDLCKKVQAPQTQNGFLAMLECIDDKSCEGLSPSEVLSLVSKEEERPLVFLVDTHTFQDPDHSLLVVDLLEKPGRTFRVMQSQVWSVENNLRLANMGFDDFAGCLDDNGVFRRFPGEPT